MTRVGPIDTTIPAVVLGLTTTGLGAVRALGVAGVHVAGATVGRNPARRLFTATAARPFASRTPQPIRTVRWTSSSTWDATWGAPRS